jgi:integrase
MKTAKQVASLRQPGRYAVGDGAYLQITGENGRSWVFRYERDGRGRHVGLGPANLVTLAEARERARAYRRLLLEGVDPLQNKAAARQKAALDAAKAVTFRQCAERYIAAHEAAWRNPVHRRQWRSTLATYVYPLFGNLPVSGVDTALVTEALEPIWTSKPETAGRVRGRIEAVLDWGKARGYRGGENPARWRGHLDKLLPNRRKVRKVKHHAALPYSEIATFMADLRARQGMGARALEFAILTAARTGEVLGARWDEIDLRSNNQAWTAPGDRMKSGKPHRVPLSGAAQDLLTLLPRESEFVFPGARSGKPLSNMSLLETLRRMGRGDLTAHGFRSTFRDWASECTNYSNEVAEAALAHAIDDKTEAAYRRGDLFEKRRRLMGEWAAYCASGNLPASQGVVPIRAVLT